MLKTLSTIGAFLVALSLASQARGQAIPTAVAPGSLQAGVGYTIANPDYGQKNIQGFTAFADYDFGLHYGIEADFHIVDLTTPTDIGENSYLIGPRFILPYRQRINFYAKGLLGTGNFRVLETQDNQGRFNGYYFAYGLGGGVDIRATHKITIRAIDIEMQKWPNWPPNGLSPIVYTVGAAYHFH